MLRERGAERLCDRKSRFSESLCRIASYNMSLLTEIAALMDQRRTFGLRFCYVPHRFKRLVFYFDSLFGSFKDIRRFCHYKADGISCHPCSVALCYHHIPVLLYVSYFVMRHIFSRKHAYNSRQRLRFFFVYLFHYCSRIV